MSLSVGLGKMADPNSSQIFLLHDNYVQDSTLSVAVPIYAYRGKTLKRTIYVWFEDGEGNRVSSRGKASLPVRFEHYNISPEITFSSCLSSGYYALVVEGIDADTREDVFVDFRCGDAEDEGETSLAAVSEGKLSFSVLSYPDMIASGEIFYTRALITNPTGEYLEVDVWSYVYRSAVCYSGEREQNMERVNVPAYSNITFDLKNLVDAETGDYNLKLKFLRTDRKTPKELTLPLRVEGDSQETGVQKKAGLVSPKVRNESTVAQENRSLYSSDVSGPDEGVVYRSSSAIGRALVPYLLIVLLIALLIMLILKRL